MINWTKVCSAVTPDAERRARLQLEVPDFLDVGSPEHQLFPHEEFSTVELIEALYPEETAHGEAITRRRLLFRDLEKLQDGPLAGYNHKDEVATKNAYGQMVHRRRWHGRRAPEPEPDWKARALAAEARLAELEKAP